MIVLLPYSNVLGEDPLWQKELEYDSNTSYSPCAVFTDINDNKLLILGIPIRNSAEEGSFLLWKMNPNGEVSSQVKFGNVPKKSTAIHRLSQYGDIAIKSDKSIFVLGDFDGNTASSLPIMSKKGDKPSVKNIPNSRVEKGKKDELILRMRPAFNNSQIFTGRQGNNGLLFKFDDTGNEVWKKTFDLGQTEIFTDVVTDNNQIYVTGYSGQVQGKMVFDTNAVQNFLLLYDSNGQLIKEEYFKGNPFPTEMPQVSRLSSGTVLVVYDKSMNVLSNDLNVRAYSPDLKFLWETQVVKTEGGTPASFRVIAVSGDKFFIGAVINVGELLLAEYTSNGKLVERWNLGKLVGPDGGLRLVELDKKIYAIFSTITYNSSQKIKIMVLAFPIS
jgi:hypothetical protein